MVGPPSYQTDPYRDTKSEGTLVEDPNMPTPWEGEVHELRDRLENSHPTRPRDYGPSDEYLRQLRREASEYRSEPPRKPSKVYAVLCCGSPVGVVAWVIVLISIAVAIGLLLTKALKPDAFSSSSSTYISEGPASGTTVTVTASTPSIAISTLTTSTLSTETETTISTSTQTTVSTDSSTSTVTYTPPTTATETRTATQTTTSLNTFTPPVPKTVTSTATPSTTSITVPTTSSFATTETSTATTFVIPTPPTVPKDTPSGGDNDDDDGSNDDEESDDGDQSDDDDDDDDDDDSTSTGKEDNQKRMTFPNETPLQAMAPLIVAATGTSKSLLLSTFSSAISRCVAHPASDRDDEASSFCGTFQGGSETQTTPTKAARKRNINFFANAAPLTETGQVSRTTKMFLKSRLPNGDTTWYTVPVPGIPPASTTITITSLADAITINPRTATTTLGPNTPSPQFTTATTATTPFPQLRRRKLAEPQVGTCTLFSGNVDCVASKAWCVIFLLLIGIGVGGILTVSLYFLLRWGWRSWKGKPEEKYRGEKGRSKSRSKRDRERDRYL